MKKKSYLGFVGVMVAALLGLALPSQSQALTFVGTRAGILQNDFTDWSQLGPSFTIVASGSTALSNLGLSVTFSQPGGSNFERFDQGNPWTGNFTPGDHLLWNGDHSSNITNITLQFGAGLFAVGTQIQTDIIGPFTGTIEAFDSLNTSLGLFTLGGNSTLNPDNSAIFMGVSDTIADIFKVTYTTDNGGFAINELAMNTAGNVPLPGTLVLLGSGLVAWPG